MLNEIGFYLLSNWQRLFPKFKRPSSFSFVQVINSHNKRFDRGKIVFLLFKDNEQMPFVVVKFFRTASRDKILENEFNVLRYLNSKLTKRFLPVPIDLVTVNNQKIYRNLTSANVSVDVENLCGEFEFESTVELDGSFPIKMNDLIQIYADYGLILTGYVDKINTSYSSKKHHIKISGRSILGDIVDTAILQHVDELKDFSMRLPDVLKYLFNSVGVVGIDVINNVYNLKPFNFGEI